MSTEAILAILASTAADGAKIAAIAALVSGKTTARDVAEVCNAKLRTVERHNTEAKALLRKFAGGQVRTSAEVSDPPLRNIAEGVRKSADEDTQICVENAPADSRAHATKELPSEVVIPKGEIPPLVPQSEKNGGMPAHVKPITDWSKAFSADLPDCEIVNERIVLRGAMRAEALEDFDGDERRLAKALDQAAGYVQANGVRPLATQVRSQLARIVGQRIDNDKRAAKPAATANGKPTVAEVMARMAAKHQAEAAA